MMSFRRYSSFRTFSGSFEPTRMSTIDWWSLCTVSVARWPIYRPLWPKVAYFESRWHILSEKIGHIKKVAYVAYFCPRSGILWPISKNCGLSHFFSTLPEGNDATKLNKV